MIALLVLLPALVLSAEYTIDWTKCGLETMCFCPKDVRDDLLTLQFPPATPANPDKFDDSLVKCGEVGMQNKFLTDDIAVFQMQVVDDPNEKGNDSPTLTLYQGNELFGCKFNPEKIEVFAQDPKWINVYKISLFEDRSRFKPGYALCSVKVEHAKKFKSKLNNLQITSMTLKTSKESTFSHSSPSTTFFEVITGAGTHVIPTKCDPFVFKDLSAHKDLYVRAVVNRDRDELNCENYGLSYTMRYRHSKKPGDIYSEIILTKMVCNRVGDGDNFVYELERGDGAKINMWNPKAYTIFCAEEFKKVCENPNDNDCAPSDKTCPSYQPGTKDRAAEIQCGEKKWLIKDKYLVLDTEPECRRDSLGNQNAAAFFSFHKGEEIKIEKGARCFTKYDQCTKHSNLFLPDCKNSTKCGVDQSDKMKLKCQDPNRQMTVQLKGEENPRNITELTCDLSVGLWQIDSTTKVPIASTVKCNELNTDSYVKAKADISDGQVDAIVYSASTGICVVILIVAIIVLFFYTRRNKTNMKKKKEWINMKKNEKIAECKELLPKSLVATPETSNLILEGLVMVDLLLDMESENMAVWNDAFKFLTRFLGTIRRIDHSIWYMFSRYTFLQAKKLIEKHGWISKTVIRKKKTRGLIRSIAIRLLSYSLCDPNSYETEELLIEGFRKLGFRGVEQYPHCGVLWSVIMHVRCEYRKNKRNPKTDLLQDDTFVNTLREIGRKKRLPEQAVIPKENQIAGIGSVAQQAAFAYGGSINQNYQTAKMKVIDKDQEKGTENDKDNWLNWSGNEEGGEVPLSFLEGACQTLTHNPCGTVLDVCRMWPYPKPELVKKMKEVAPEKRWNAIIMGGIRHAAYYGRNMDSMRLRERFLPPHFDDEIGQLHIEQQKFEEAMEKEKEHLRSWLVDEVDKEELKKKPDYTIKSNVKLDNRVTAQGTESMNKKGADACTPDLKSGSKSESKSESKSNSTDHDPGAASPASPASPAAPAAAPEAAAPAEAAASPAAPK